MNLLFSPKKYLIVSLVILIPVGLATKHYTGPAADIIVNHSGGTFYVIFWCLFLKLILIRSKPVYICLFSLIITCMIELLQLWHPPFLEIIRSNYAGRILWGSSYSTADFPWYILGSIIGWIWIWLIYILTDQSQQIQKPIR